MADAAHDRVSACISRYRSHVKSQRQAVAKCLSMERAKRLSERGAYKPVKKDVS